MSSEFQPFGRALILFGLILIGVGLVMLAGPRLPWLGRLPGDILIQGKRTTFYFPLASCLLASVIFSLILWLIGRWR